MSATETATLADLEHLMADRVRAIVARELACQVEAIDKGELYPGDILRQFGEAGAFATHKVESGKVGLGDAIESIAAIAERCGATAFMTWCQDALVWYLTNSDNEILRESHLESVATGRVLGGTGLSNPMKTFAGIETLKLKGRRAEGGYIVRGSLPWVSNLGPDHLFGAVFEKESTANECVMFVADCAAANVTLQPCGPFLAMDGTGTFSVQFRDVFVPDSMVLADPAMDFVKKIRAGFVLLQTGMAIGLIRDCIKIMNEVGGTLGHVNQFLDAQPEDIAASLAALEKEVRQLAATPHDPSELYWKRVLTVRLRGGEASVAAAHAAMLHCGARGYVMTHRAQRRLREAYFVAIVTPATKHLHKMLAELSATEQGAARDVLLA